MRRSPPPRPTAAASTRSPGSSRARTPSSSSRPIGYALTAADQGSDATDSDADQGTGRTDPITVTSGQTLTSVDAGLYVAASIGDLVWFDVDADGSFTPGTDRPLPGVTVSLSGTDGAGNSVSASTTTNASGLYAFAGLVPGSYTVTVGVGVPGATEVTYDRDGGLDSTTPVTLASGDAVSDADFGYTGTLSIGDVVFEDVDGDGVFTDGTDIALGGVDMTAVWAGPDGIAGNADDVTYLATTAVDGTYTIDHLADGAYVVDADENGTGLADPVATTSDPAAITLAGASRDDIDFGYYSPVSVGDFVWVDDNGNGIQDSGEAGLAGVTVELLSGATVVDSTRHRRRR